MAENLLNTSRTPWQQRAADPGFGYAGGFQNILTAYNGLNHRGANKRYKDNQELFKQQIEHLRELKQVLEEDEDEFFELFGINEKNKRNSFIKLKEKINTWYSYNTDRLITDANKNNEFYKGLRAIQNLAIAAEITEEEWESTLTQAFNTEEGKKNISALLDENRNINIAKILNTLIGKNTFSANKNSTLLDNLSIIFTESGDIKIVSQQQNISPALQKKIIKALKEYLQDKSKEKKKANYDFKKMFTALFQELGIEAEGQHFLLMALGDMGSVLQRYDFNSDSNKIKGFLGEVNNNAFLYYMADKSKRRQEAIKRITPTGSIREEKSGSEVVIDTWLDGFGIQVKNYEKNKVWNSGFRFQKSMEAGHFIQNVLQLNAVGTSNTASVGDILLNFFTAYDYNQDYSKKDSSIDTKADAYKFWKAARDRMDEKYKDSKAFTNIVMPYIDKVIGIDRHFTSRDSSIFVPEDEEQTFRNTFFNISGNYIPSSVLVQAIIDTINKKGDLASMMTAEFRTTSYSNSSKDKWAPNVTNETVQKVYKDRINYANSSRIGYTIDLNVQELANYLLTQLQ